MPARLLFPFCICSIRLTSTGNVSRFSDVKKKTKEKSKTPAKEAPIATEKSTPTPARGGRGRGGLEGSRGGRGRGTERGRSRGTRGAASSTTRSASATTLIPTADSVALVPTVDGGDSSWDSGKAAAASDGQWGSVIASGATPATASEGMKSSLIPEGTKKSWASMLAESKPAALKAVPPAPPVVDPDISSAQEFITQDAQNDLVARDGYGPPALQVSDGTAELAPSKDPLTENKLGYVPDVSEPAPTGTIASTLDPNSAVGTPYGSVQHLPVGRGAQGGYAAAAWKGSGAPQRSASFQRRIMEQREAVIMPGNHALDRTAVQFGSLGLNGEGPQDVDDDREDAETRAQPQQSPVSQPRAALPPSLQQKLPPEHGLQDLQLKQAPGLAPPMSQPHLVSQQIGSDAQMPQSVTDAHQQYRYGGAIGSDPRAAPQKAHDAFSQQLNYPGQQDTQSAYSGQATTTTAEQSNIAAYSQAPGDFASQYSMDRTYGGYHGGPFGQQASSQQDQAVPQRSGSGLGTTDAGFSGHSQAAARFNEPRTSGQATPNPPGVAQQAGSHAPGPMHQQSHGQAGYGYYNQPQYSGYSYGSYMNNVRSSFSPEYLDTANFALQYPGYSYNQGYNAPYGKQANMYGQPHQGYQMPTGSSYDQSSTQASGMRDSSYSASTGDYNRSSSAQPQNQQTSSNFGGSMPDPFGRSSSGFQAGVSSHQQTQASTEENLRPYESSGSGIKSGPSPGLGQQQQRSGSATNDRYSMQDARYSNTQSSYGPQGGMQGSYAQSQQQGYAAGSYPSHLYGNQASQHGALGSNLGGQHQHTGQTGYSNYTGFGNYSGYQQRGGWGGNYGH